MAPRVDPAAPPTKVSVTDTDGNLQLTSDPISFFLWHHHLEESIKKQNHDFYELVVNGFATNSKYVVVTRAEQAVILAAPTPNTTYTFASPSPRMANSATAMPGELEKRYVVNPEAVDKLDRTGATTIAGLVGSERVRKELESASGGSGRRMLIAIQTKKNELHQQSGVTSLLVKYAEYYFRAGIPAPTTDAFDDWVDAVQLWNNASPASCQITEILMGEKVLRATRNLGDKFEQRIDAAMDRLSYNHANPAAALIPSLSQIIQACRKAIDTQSLREMENVQDGHDGAALAALTQGQPSTAASAGIRSAPVPLFLNS